MAEDIKMDEDEKGELIIAGTAESVLMPVWAAHFDKLILVCCPEMDGDAPARPTLDEVYDRQYDPHILARISAVLPTDREHWPYVTFDGTLLLQASAALSRAEDAAREFNRIFGMLLLGGMYLGSVTPARVRRASLSADGWYTITDQASERFLLHRPWEATAMRVIDLFRAKIIWDYELHAAYSVGECIAERLDKFPLHLLSVGLTTLSERDFDSAVLALWTCAERLLVQAFDQELVARVSKACPGVEPRLLGLERRRADERAAALEQAGFLTGALPRLEREVRTARDQLVHHGEPPTAKQAKHAATLIFGLLGRLAGDRASPNLWEPMLSGLIDGLEPKPDPFPPGTPIAEIPHPEEGGPVWFKMHERELLVTQPNYPYDPRGLAGLRAVTLSRHGLRYLARAGVK